MRIKFHCRNCNELGDEDLNLETLLKIRLEEESLLDLVMRSLNHKCSDPKLGIKIGD